MCCSVDDHTAGSKAAYQCTDAVLHLDAGKAQTESGLHILQPVVNENTFPGLELVFVQQGLIDARANSTQKKPGNCPVLEGISLFGGIR